MACTISVTEREVFGDLEGTYTRKQRCLNETQDESDCDKTFVALHTGGGGRDTGPDEGTAGEVDAGTNDGHEHVGRDLANNVTEETGQ
jgi:hypothetical protein